MRLLLDTHTLIWAVESPELLGPMAVAAMEDNANQLLLSAGSLWELAIKVGPGKMSLSSPYRLWMTQAISELNALILPITVDHSDVQSGLPRHHGDPFDRLLIAQATVEAIPLVSNDAMFDSYGMVRIW